MATSRALQCNIAGFLPQWHMHNDRRRACSELSSGWRDIACVHTQQSCHRPLSAVNSPFSRRENVPSRTIRCNQRSEEVGESTQNASSVDILSNDLPANGAVASTSLVGEDAAAFDLANERVSSWAAFFAVLTTVMIALYFIWLDPNTGLGGKYIDAVTGFTDVPEIQMLALLLVFAIVHSGGAAVRRYAEPVIGERAYRVLFAGISLPLAVSTVVFFITHRYEGAQLWYVRAVPGVHELVWALSFISFFFLYPSTFNLLEVAAVDKPKVHMWETGVMRITRHPQMVGQLIWCLAHTLWVGSSFMLATSAGLMAHHLFGAWHGDQRLAAKYGPAFDKVKERTSIIPFAAVVEGRQQLPKDYYKEFLRMPYFAIIAMTVGAYFCHPLMIKGAYALHW